MKITFVHHSCFVVETDTKTLIFDYFPKGDMHGYVFTGELPEISADMPVYFFASHAHQDHFSLDILRLAGQYTDVKYILSKDIRLSERYLERNGIDPSIRQKITFVAPCKHYEIDDMKIRTLRSTDAGVAYLVETDGKVIYHAGDLNLWKWDGAGELVNGREARSYKHEINKLRDVSIDVAFVPVDSRQKSYATEGLAYFMEQVDAKAIFPMHMWQEYDAIRAYKSKISNADFARRLVEITGENEEYELCER